MSAILIVEDDENLRLGLEDNLQSEGYDVATAVNGLDAVWGADVHVDARTVDNFVLSLRKKLRWEPASSFEIATVRGVGYRMTVE